jgi:hypothetical protein
VTFLSSTQLQMSITTQTTADNWTVKVTNPGVASEIAVSRQFRLADAIGANTAFFVIDAVILRPLAYKDPSRRIPLVDGTTYSDFQAWNSQNQDFSDMAAYYRL